MSIWAILKIIRNNCQAKKIFYSPLADRKTTDKKYKHVLNVWKKKRNENNERLSWLILKMRCFIISCDMLEKFRNNSLNNYVLRPSHYLSAPGLSWDAMLKMTKIKLELIPDPGMYTFIEKRTTGGISYISNRYSKTNNKYLKS